MLIVDSHQIGKTMVYFINRKIEAKEIPHPDEEGVPKEPPLERLPVTEPIFEDPIQKDHKI